MLDMLLSPIMGIFGKTVEPIFKEFDPQYRSQEKWAERNWSREELWRNEDITRAELWRNEDRATAEKWRYEDIERNSLAHRMGELSAAGLHPALAAGAGGGGGGGGGGAAMGRAAPMTGAGGRVPRPTPSQPMDMMSGVEMARVGIQSRLAEAEKNHLDAQARLIAAQAQDQENKNELFNTYESREKQLHEKTIEEINSRISSSEANDKLTDKQREVIEKELDRMVYDNKILLKDDGIFLTGSTTTSEILGDLIRAIGDTELAKRIINIILDDKKTDQKNNYSTGNPLLDRMLMRNQGTNPNSRQIY